MYPRMFHAGRHGVAIALLLLARTPFAASLAVTSTADAGAGTLREAITIANSNFQDDTITFNLTPPATITLASALPVIASDDGNELVIEGPGAPDDLIVQAAADAFTADYRVFEVALGGDASISGMTIRHGRQIGAQNAGQITLGGGIRNAGSLLLANVVLSNNTSVGSPNNVGGNGSDGRGGAIHSSGSLTIQDSTLQFNVAGGNVGASGGAGSGGAIHVSGGTALLSGVTITGNVASGGAAVSSQGGTGSGGGIFVEAGSGALVAIANSTISGNTASGGAGGGASATTDGFAIGGGLRGNNDAGGVSLRVEFSTIVNNSVNSFRTNGALGGGVSSNGSTDDQGVRLRATIVANNIQNFGSEDIPDDIHGNILSSDFNLIETTTDGTVDVAGTGVDGFANSGAANILGQDPNLGPLANNGGPTGTHALLDPSPAFNAGTATLVQGFPNPFDQRGTPRPSFFVSDIGAFESTSVVPVGISEAEID